MDEGIQSCDFDFFMTKTHKNGHIIGVSINREIKHISQSRLPIRQLHPYQNNM